MSFVAVAIGGGALISGGLGYLGATQAANTQAGEEQQALALQQQQMQNLKPYETLGAGAAQQLGALQGINGQQPNYSTFYNSPDYQFALQQGTQGVSNYENAMGLGQSGGALAAIAQFNQGLASQQYGNYYNRLMGLAQLGSGAAQSGVGGANAQAQTLGSIGQSQASGIIGGTNALTSGINSGISNSLLYNALSNRSAYAQPSVMNTELQ